MHDYPVILCEPFLHFLLPSGMMDKTDGRDRRMAQYYMLYKPRGLLTAKRDARRETVMSCFPEALRETLHPVVDRWNEYMKDVMLMEMDPETGAQPLMKQVFFFN